MKISKQGKLQRIGPSDKDCRQCKKREFDAKGLNLIRDLREELDRISSKSAQLVRGQADDK